tara:strand:+ start:236 stop:664 length:429 start_codon:yes stop_codon:yes gene_type:complete
MNKEKMVLYLGYAALVLIGLYFTVGILKISGEGLAKLGYPNNFIQEGFSDKQKEEKLKKIKKDSEQMKAMNEHISKLKDQLNTVNDMPEYEELIDSYKNYIDVVIRITLQNALTSGKSISDTQMKMLLKMKEQKDLLDNYTI